ncbi:MAG TPA: SDR family NAD(P)-dependent oxidoreductase [Methylomirabilota bacterium]|nr:SDR family NAD(P)-dependent oxidoreductase [Methylomirabilota bacterium]
MKTNHLHQTVILTGGATGIGYAVAEQFVARGANVRLNGRTRAKLAGAAEKLGKPDRVAFIAADITQPKVVPHDHDSRTRLFQNGVRKTKLAESSGPRVLPRSIPLCEHFHFLQGN